MDIFELMVNGLEIASDAITSFANWLPNPDPFPEMLDNIENNPASELDFAMYWIGNFVDINTIIFILELWFVMFPLAWGIMTIHHWLKTR